MSNATEYTKNVNHMNESLHLHILVVHVNFNHKILTHVMSHTWTSAGHGQLRRKRQSVRERIEGREKQRERESVRVRQGKGEIYACKHTCIPVNV